MADRAATFIEDCLTDSDTLLAICSTLKDLRNTSPARVLEESVSLYTWLTNAGKVGVFDEYEYFLGQVSFLIGSVFRLTGRWDDAELWLERAESSYRHTMNPGPLMATVAYERLALHYARHRYERVLDLVPSLRASFAKLNMPVDALKCRYLEAVTLNELARSAEACDRLQNLRSEAILAKDPTLEGLVLAKLAEVLASSGRYSEATVVYRDALASPSVASQPLARAQLNAALGETLRGQSHLQPAVESYRAAIQVYGEMGMSTVVAYYRIIVAETLIALGRNHEAEWEIRAALPTIEEQKMESEGLAAASLLKESVRRRSLDSKALGTLRHHLQAKS